MRYPFVEGSAGWDWLAVYYGSAGRRTTKGIDLADEKILCAEVLIDIARLGGSHNDIRLATVFETARLVAMEMQVTPTGPLVDDLAALDPALSAMELVSSLRHLADEQLTGAALSSVLRALAWWKYRRGPLEGLPVRVELLNAARKAIRDAGCIAGYASTVADDAHAHLWVSERVQVPPGGDRRAATLSFRDQTARSGYAFLATAFALATQEPWDPFLSNRLAREVEEHKVLLSNSTYHDSNYLPIIVHAYANTWPELAERWHEEVRRHDGDDIAAFFTLRRSDLARPRETVSPLMQDLIVAEPMRERLL